MRVDGVLQGAGEELAAGVADQDRAAYVGERGVGQVDVAEAGPPRAAGPLGVAGGDLGAAAGPLGAGPAGGATLEPLLELLADRLGVGRQVAAEPVGQPGRLLRDAR